MYIYIYIYIYIHTYKVPGIGRSEARRRRRAMVSQKACIGNFASQEFDIFVCAVFVDVLQKIAEICGDCHFPL